jgi:hypothetical protein
MKKSILLTIFAVGLTVATALTSKAASSLDFKLDNECGQTIERVYISPHNYTSWQEDVLHDDVLSDGYYTNILFSPRETHRYWDIKIVTRDGENHLFQDAYDLTRIYLIKFEQTDGGYQLHYWFR